MRKRTAISLTVGTGVLFVALGLAGNAITDQSTNITDTNISRTVEANPLTPLTPAGIEVTYTPVVLDGETVIEKRTTTSTTIIREIVEAF